MEFAGSAAQRVRRYIDFVPLELGDFWYICAELLIIIDRSHYLLNELEISQDTDERSLAAVHSL